MWKRINAMIRRQEVWRWMTELPILLALFAVVGGVWLFAEVTDEVVEAETQDFDHAILRAMRDSEDPSDPWGPGWLEGAAKDLTAMGNYAPMFVVLFSTVAYFLLMRQWGRAVLVSATVLLGFALTHLLKAFIGRERPEIVPHLVDVTTKSFPSGHAMMSAVMYLTIGALLAQAEDRLRAKLYIMGLAIALTLAIGATRVYLGVHYPTDVLAGWSLGTAWAALMWLAAWAVHRRRRGRDGGLGPASGRGPKEGA